VLTQLRQQAGFLAAMAKVGFSTYLAYPAGVGMVFLSYPIVIFMYRFVMTAVYANGEREVGGYDLTGILTYVTISWILNTFYMTPTGRTLGHRVRDGQVAMDLIKPINLMSIYFGQGIGRTAFRLVFATIPLLVIFSFFLKIIPPQGSLILPFCLTVLCGYLINFQMDYMIGLIAFYMGYNNGIRWGIRLIMNITGGMVIPLTFFPDSIAAVFKALPTQYMFYQPMQVYLGRVDFYGAWAIAVSSLAWVVALFGCAQLVQFGGVRKLNISGG
jgi:ABC-2 type transport system permease protein